MRKDCKVQTYSKVNFPCANPKVEEKKPEINFFSGDLNKLFDHEDDPID